MVNCKRYEGRVCLVTAGTAGIGLGTALRLGQEGAKVVICSRKQQNVEQAVQQLRSAGCEAAGIAAHVGSKADLERLVAFTVNLHGRIDVLVSNAAVNPEGGPIMDMQESSIDKIIEINIKAAIMLTREVVRHMPAGGAIVYVSSYTAFNPAAPISLYAVSKTALLGLTKALAAEFAPRGLRVNCVAPGIVPTKFASALVADPEAEQRQRDATLLGKLGRPQDMAAAVAFLCSEDAAYVTGETLVVAGGMQSRL